ncbi:MAG: serine hydrolase [Prolixibacteraceae bacterium]|jgi:CubicO group peptidase (beta-lactamase class C family)|nr:serine hydrolase [Prolixibacteraceae bacterium]
MKVKGWKFYSVLIFIVCCLPIYMISTSSSNISPSNELIGPVNQRLTNELSDFEYTPYINRQIERFMERSELMGASVAIVKDEELVFSRAYGYADYEKGEFASPQNLFRLASVSKLVTGVAIMKLVENGKLRLNDKVFGENAILNDSLYGEIRDEKIKNITIRHLLEHTAGWTQRYGDPAFNPLVIARRVGDNPPATIDTYLKFVFSRRLHFPPGTMYSYSNMGYMFLGKVIEEVTGMKYEDYVRYHILLPYDICDMYLARNLYEEKYPNEVRYYEQEGSLKIRAHNGETALVAKAYGGNDIELLSSAGGWVASAPELAKLVTLIDGGSVVADCLSAESIEEMVRNRDRPLGWKSTNLDNWVRTGSFAGTVAMVVRQSDGISWVFLSNKSNWQGPGFYHEVKRVMNRIIRKVNNDWPNQNLFNYYSPESLSSLPIIDDVNTFPVN